MELNTTTYADSDNIAKSLGIQPERSDELIYFLESEILDLFETGPSDLVPIYKSIASKCNNLEEYTMLLQILLFYCARYGKLNTEPARLRR